MDPLLLLGFCVFTVGIFYATELVLNGSLRLLAQREEFLSRLMQRIMQVSHENRLQIQRSEAGRIQRTSR